MLELKNIKKTYQIGDIETKALDGISVAFRQKEFVAILGASGSGKTTCLNIVGGLDRYDSGEMTIKGKDTKNFKERDWDAYRNNSIGFIFQSYNLITHLSIVANVELSMTLSGVSKSEKRRRALEVLERVGLKDHLHKKPNQMSGGQMQRVAIARALVNNPEILLCDEPTGALDTETSRQIMELIKEIANDRLVIMVTHNPEIANEYADRIIRFEDGQIVSDSNPHQERPKDDQFRLKKTSMSFFTALNLSFNNIRTKKGRTFLTSFASSIGIIGIAVILSLSTGFQQQIDMFQSDAMAEFPIIITQNAMQMDAEAFGGNGGTSGEASDGRVRREEYADTDQVYLYNPADNRVMHKNVFSAAFMQHLDNIDPQVCSSIGYTRLVSMNLVRKADDTVRPVSMPSMMEGMGNGGMASMQGAGLSSYPTQINSEKEKYLEKNYQVLSGRYPTDATDLVLVIDTRNRINFETLKMLGFETTDIEGIKFTDIIGTEFKLVSNNDYYAKTEMGMYLPGNDYQKMFDSSDSLTLKIVGVVRQKEDSTLAIMGSGLAYSDELSQLVIDRAQGSEIVKAQQDVDYNVMTTKEFKEGEKDAMLAVLGGDATPFMVMVYPNSFDDKDALVSYLEEYNEGKKQEDTIVFTDLAESLSKMTGGIMTGITFVLIAFAGISLVVSLIMICIITYTSVLERTKEIGILKSLGARKKDITRVFDAETCLLGVFSGVLGIAIAFAATFPINIIIKNVSGLENVATLQVLHAVILVAISTLLTMAGGHIPARMASKKDAVEALRSE